MNTTETNPTGEISRRIRAGMVLAGKKRVELRTALAPATPNKSPMAESPLTRRLAGEHTWDIHELAIVATFLGVTLTDLVRDADLTTTEES